ncbi:hypothetical protein SFR_6079 [Streptomyces sp. FR-008]|nr:hypothetical protein SFR_6079 [Streptomyces sp. FR-008]
MSHPGIIAYRRAGRGGRAGGGGRVGPPGKWLKERASRARIRHVE